MKREWAGLRTFSSVFLRLAVGLSFLSAVADRLGLWGAYGQANVAWGDFARFVEYTGRLNWFLPAALVPALAVIATVAEAVLGFMLVVGWKTRAAAFWSGTLLLVFAAAMTLALGVKAPLNLSVFSASGGAFLLANCARFPLSVDAWLARERGEAWGIAARLRSFRVA